MHQPVMVAEVLSLIPENAELVLDMTIGGSGHSLAMLKHLGREAELVGFDRDVEALGIAEKRLRESPNKKKFIHSSYAEIENCLGENLKGKADFILYDLGLSSRQLAFSGRGFSFDRAQEPLDLRFDPSMGQSLAAKLTATSVAELARVLSRYGEVRNAKRISRAIVSAQQDGKLNCVGDLAAIVTRFARPGRENKLKAKIWQGLRLWINSELDELERGLQSAVAYLRDGGVMAAISFHSLEDRIVKRFFVAQENPCICPRELPVCACGRQPTLERITRRPILPSDEEITVNPRARSAKLRAARKLPANRSEER